MVKITRYFFIREAFQGKINKVSKKERTCSFLDTKKYFFINYNISKILQFILKKRGLKMKKILFGFVLVSTLFLAGCSSEDVESDTVESSQQTTETTMESSEDSEDVAASEEEEIETNESSGEEIDSQANEQASDELEAQLEKLSDTYADLIAEVEGYIANPETYDLSAYTSVMRSYTDLMREFQTTTETIEAADLGDGWAYYDIYMDILEESVKLTEAFANLPEMQQ